jgi:hypothetical protein
VQDQCLAHTYTVVYVLVVAHDPRVFPARAERRTWRDHHWSRRRALWFTETRRSSDVRSKIGHITTAGTTISLLRRCAILTSSPGSSK